LALEDDIKQGRQFSNEYEKLVVNMIYTNSWISEQQLKIFKPYGITSPQYNVLRILRGHYPKPCTINSIIERMLDRMSNASRIVDRLESKDLVVRKINVADKRAKDVLITEAGLALLSSVDEKSRQWMSTFSKIGEERIKETNILLDELRDSCKG
jgi:DNA-binding MarR family transcriptional regulator